MKNMLFAGIVLTAFGGSPCKKTRQKAEVPVENGKRKEGHACPGAHADDDAMSPWYAGDASKRGTSLHF